MWAAGLSSTTNQPAPRVRVRARLQITAVAKPRGSGRMRVVADPMTTTPDSHRGMARRKMQEQQQTTTNKKIHIHSRLGQSIWDGGGTAAAAQHKSEPTDNCLLFPS